MKKIKAWTLQCNCENEDRTCKGLMTAGELVILTNGTTRKRDYYKLFEDKTEAEFEATELNNANPNAEVKIKEVLILT